MAIFRKGKTMRFAVQQSSMLRVLQQVVNAVERKQVMQILGNVLLEVSDNILRITGGDGEIEVSATLPLEIVYVEGATTIPAKKLFDITRSLASDIILEFSKETTHCQVLAGSSRFALATREAGDYPKLQDLDAPHKIELESQGKLKRMLERTSFSMGVQDVRSFLNGMLLEFDDNSAVAVATDGHRLSLNRQDVEFDISSSGKQQIILPRKAVAELIRLLGDGNSTSYLCFGESHFRLEVGNLRFTTKLISGRFPDYQKVIPKNLETSCVIAVDALKQALSRSAIMSNDKYKGVRFALEPNQLTLLARNQEQEESRDELVVDYSGDGLTVSFNISYIIDILNVIDDEWIRITFANSNSSALLEEVSANDSLYIIMPMKL